MDRTRGISAYATAVIIFGVYNLLGSGSYGNFTAMFKGLNGALVMVIYAFTVFYGICGVYCGTKILKLEDWARKMIVGVTAISVILSFVLNKLVFTNFKDFVASGKAGVPLGDTGSIFRSAVILAALVTVFEISVVFYFTRPAVRRQFK